MLGKGGGTKLIQCVSTALKELLDEPLVGVGSENSGGQRTVMKGTGSNFVFAAPME